MDRRFQDEEKAMKCHVCGGTMEPIVTDMPFKTDAKRIVIVKELPVRQCGSCGEYLIEDPVMARVDALLAKADRQAELEIVLYAA
jgi:YgiT-type zinc finger domain-containing protein